MVAALLGLTGCTTTELARTESRSAWAFNIPADKTAECLRAGLNQEWRPQSTAMAILGGSISHDVLMIERDRLYHVAPPSTPNGTLWLFVVTKESESQTIATAQIAPQLVPKADALAKMSRAAVACGGQPR
jgi:hypothetical protein